LHALFRQTNRRRTAAVSQEYKIQDSRIIFGKIKISAIKKVLPSPSIDEDEGFLRVTTSLAAALQPLYRRSAHYPALR